MGALRVWLRAGGGPHGAAVMLADVPFEAAHDVAGIGLRLHPLDVGFDLRTGGAQIVIDDSPTLRASYATRSGERRVVEGSRADVIHHLRAHGYTVAGP